MTFIGKFFKKKLSNCKLTVSCTVIICSQVKGYCLLYIVKRRITAVEQSVKKQRSGSYLDQDRYFCTCSRHVTALAGRPRCPYQLDCLPMRWNVKSEKSIHLSWMDFFSFFPQYCRRFPSQLFFGDLPIMPHLPYHSHYPSITRYFRSSKR